MSAQQEGPPPERPPSCKNSDSQPVDRPQSPDITLIACTSDSSLICRICQLNEKESGVDLLPTGCACRGSLALTHRACVLEWVQSRLSGTCELCGQPFGNQEELQDHVQRAAKRAQWTRIQDNMGQPETELQGCCSNSRRMWFAIILVLLILATVSAAGLTLYMDEDFNGFNEPSVAPGTVEYVDFHQVEFADQEQFCYAMSASVLGFCSTLTVTVFLLWGLAECYIWPREVELRQQWRDLARIQLQSLAAARRPFQDDLSIHEPTEEETMV